MNTLGNIYLSSHAIYVTLIVSCFFMVLVVDDDELHQYAMNRAIKVSVIISILSLLGYAFYMLASGSTTISIHVLFFGIEALSLLTLLLYYLELKGFSFSIKKSKKIGNILITLSLIISVLSTISMIFNFKLFSNPTGLIRYDELLLFVNVIFIPLFIPFFPNIKKILSRDEYKKERKDLDKKFKIFIVIYAICFLLFIVYIIYRYVVK